MHVALLLATTLAFLSLTGSSSSANLRPSIQLDSPTALKARALYQGGFYREASEHYQIVVDEFLKNGDVSRAIAATNNIASCLINTSSYRKALTVYLQARNLALKTRNGTSVAVIDANLALLYGLMGDYQKTIDLGEQVLQEIGEKPSLIHPHLLLYLANSYHRTDQFQKAEGLYLEAARYSDLLGNTKQQAMAFDHLGLAYIDREKPNLAAPYIYEAFRLRKLSVPEEVFLSHRSLGKLRAKQNRFEESEFYLNQAIHRQLTHPGRTHTYELYAERAMTRSMQKDFSGAFADYRTAFRMIRYRRLEHLPAAEILATSEASLNKIRSAFIHFIGKQAIDSGDQSLAIEALAIAEESRAASLRTGFALNRPDLPPEYQQLLLQLQRAEEKLLSTHPGNPENASLEADIRQSLLRLTEIETLTNQDTTFASLPVNPLARVQEEMRKLSPDEVVFSFHLDDPHSYIWEITATRVQMRKISARTEVREGIRQFLEDIKNSESDLPLYTGRIYSQIFGDISPYSSTKKVWTMIPDDRLFDLPFAAIAVPSSNCLRPDDHATKKENGGFLIERHTLRLKPSLFFSSTHPDQDHRPFFIGLGDAIYNQADSRLAPELADVHSNTVQLPRLFSSAKELHDCARAWGSNSILLTGEQATQQAFIQANSQPAGILHIAAHFVPSQEDGTRTMIALGYNPSTQTQNLLGATQIASLNNRLNLVVLSGCRSGFGQQLPGAGLMGLTRSWLLAGASNIAASYWNIPDYSGEIFVRFYDHYAKALHAKVPYPAAQALRLAQLDMLASDDWRSAISHWASFFLISRG